MLVIYASTDFDRLMVGIDGEQTLGAAVRTQATAIACDVCNYFERLLVIYADDLDRLLVISGRVRCSFRSETHRRHEAAPGPCELHKQSAVACYL